METFKTLYLQRFILNDLPSPKADSSCQVLCLRHNQAISFAPGQVGPERTIILYIGQDIATKIDA